MYKISIIVPIYNVEEFIDESIKSILNQSIGFENLEVILVDDCSTDKSGEIAKKYSELYENIIYYKMPENSGMAGKPRNVGMQMAKGKYIMFLDPDDCYMPYACELMYDTIEEQNVKFVAANYKKIDVNGNDLGKIGISKDLYRNQKIYMSKNIDALKLVKDVCWNKIISRAFILENEIYFLEGVPAEDAYFSSKVFLIARQGYYECEPIVQYRIRDFGNLSETNNLKEKYFKRATIAYREIAKLFQNYPEENYYQYYYISSIMYIINKLVLSTQIDNSENKARILMDMSDLLEYAQKLKINLDIKSDDIGFMSVFLINGKEAFKEYIEGLENQYRKLGVDEISKIQKNIIEELQKN